MFQKLLQFSPKCMTDLEAQKTSTLEYVFFIGKRDKILFNWSV